MFEKKYATEINKVPVIFYYRRKSAVDKKGAADFCSEVKILFEEMEPKALTTLCMRLKKIELKYTKDARGSHIFYDYPFYRIEFLRAERDNPVQVWYYQLLKAFSEILSTTYIIRTQKRRKRAEKISADNTLLVKHITKSSHGNNTYEHAVLQTLMGSAKGISVASAAYSCFSPSIAINLCASEFKMNQHLFRLMHMSYPSNRKALCRAFCVSFVLSCWAPFFILNSPDGMGTFKKKIEGLLGKHMAKDELNSIFLKTKDFFAFFPQYKILPIPLKEIIRYFGIKPFSELDLSEF